MRTYIYRYMFSSKVASDAAKSLSRSRQVMPETANESVSDK